MSDTNQAQALAKAIHAALSNDVAVQSVLGQTPRLYDHPPEDPIYPYLTYGPMRSEDIGGDDFDLVERATGLSFVSRGVQSAFALDAGKLGFEQGHSTLSVTRLDAETRLKDVRVSFIDQTKDYQSGSVLARDLFAETERIVDIAAPLVLDAGQAKIIATAVLEQVLHENEIVDFSVPPSMLKLECGDALDFGGLNGHWQITGLDGLGKRKGQAKRIGAGSVNLTSSSAPGVVGAPDWVSVPEGFALDIADFSGTGERTGPLVGVIMNPFVGTSITGPGGAETNMDTPVIIGALLSDLPAGPVGRFDLANQIDILLPGVTLVSLPETGALSGGNMLAVETVRGWEILAGS